MNKIKDIQPNNKHIEVNPYLTYSQIQSIINAVCKFETWAERQQNIDILLLHFATNLSDKEIEDYGHDVLLNSGLIDEVKQSIKNYNQILEGIQYSQSWENILTQLSKRLPEITKPLQKVVGFDKSGSK